MKVIGVSEKQVNIAGDYTLILYPRDVRRIK